MATSSAKERGRNNLERCSYRLMAATFAPAGLTLAARLGFDDSAVPPWQVWCNIFGNVSPTSDYNIFLVDRLKQKDMRFFVRAFTPPNAKTVALNASVIPGVFAWGLILAHELGHFLLAPYPSFLGLDADGHSAGQNDLMQVHPGPEDIKIPKEQANFMNLSGWD